MNIWVSVIKRLFFFTLLVVVSACARKPAQIESGSVSKHVSDQLEIKLLVKDAPDWVNRGSAILSGPDGRMFHGVGFAFPMGDMAQQKAVADDRARSEVERVLMTYLDVVLIHYMADAKVGNDFVNIESVSQQLKKIAKSNLSVVRIIKGWRDPQTSAIWSMAELDMNDVKHTMAEAEGMDAGLKHYIETSADNIFDRVAEAKNR
jgi:hypothetical protein